ncbi:two-component system, chemotaxis family, response regulator CheY [Candidatus Kryptonium thompsonii]|uniref:Two-component system, chemotaxis family, response regulator CheY n=1 Tax=Candidatus Kryptonium thompsonii TaxID=1633631 RepID=A0A0N7MNV5_9BACT|nr:chemotaxis response regulator CheY [Candidatus Kryptonium thompsoni]CUS77299.1 two-component system, chemotaxis family, response regulator CheY [Candidatus Kryptonium thompsoni]CUS78949.1 two-component system, chemotaxis family, response regulator CheY [Candidatus Kryptonium thompsoni]CUS79940.1 two-component system, chemotaxis family, response regulator CheY [Candidatus Kryptonium thompsoni]CUS86222.1 two-component system, chemotaxis family, response regulator CheY [Candidatus Kryptonium th
MEDGKIRFLVVDDSPTMRRIVINALKNIGYTDIVEAEDGKDALAKLYAERIDFIITDWNMPNMGGLELTKAVRSDPNFANIPILMVTTRAMKEDVLEALQARVNNYIVKPFTPQILKEKIEQILKTL